MGKYQQHKGHDPETVLHSRIIEENVQIINKKKFRIKQEQNPKGHQKVRK